MSVPVSYGNVITEIQMQQDEIDYMVKLINDLPEDALFVEWGSGGSTCKWLETLRNLQRLISIEHNESWYNRVTRAVKNHFGDVSERFEYIHIPEAHGLEHGYGNVLEEHPFGTLTYMTPKDEIFDADVFFIDGIARGACAVNTLLRYTRPDAAFFIHDYVGRETWYEWATQYFDVEVVGTTLARLYPKKQFARG